MSEIGEQPVEFIEEQDIPKPKDKKGVRVKDFLSGNILTHENISAQLPYVLFLAFLAVVYISNHYRYDRLMREDQKVKTELKNLRAESITTAAELMFISKQSEVVKLVEENGLELKESTVPPKKIK
ncbi:MAG: FtsL-like putative cell division protein [Bacteroidales bacterium]